jgi:hypothetical protein
MTKSHPKREEALPLRPVGVALAAVVAGLGAAKAQAAEAAPLEPATQEKTYAVDPTNHPGFEEDPDMVVGQSDPVEPLRPR